MASRSPPSIGDGEEVSIEDLYNINVIPSELFLKFRKQLQGIRLGLNLEFYNLQSNEFRAKVVVKPLSHERLWKLAFEPIQKEIRVLSKKIPVTKFLNLQIGIGHNFHYNAIGWKWRLSTCWGGDGVSQIRNRTSFGLFPGLDLRIGWRAEYVLPEIHGGLGTGESVFNMTYGRLHASIERVEAILTH